VPPERWHWYDVLSRQPWVWHVRLTFEYLATPGQAKKRWGQWVRVVEDWERFERNVQVRAPKVVSWALSTQLQSRRVASYHALVSGVTSPTESWAIRQWECGRDGEITIFPYNHSRLEAFIANGDRIEVSDSRLSPTVEP
jgi:hypothetical protein